MYTNTLFTRGADGAAGYKRFIEILAPSTNACLLFFFYKIYFAVFVWPRRLSPSSAAVCRVIEAPALLRPGLSYAFQGLQRTVMPDYGLTTQPNSTSLYFVRFRSETSLFHQCQCQRQKREATTTGGGRTADIPARGRIAAAPRERRTTLRSDPIPPLTKRATMLCAARGVEVFWFLARLTRVSLKRQGHV